MKWSEYIKCSFDGINLDPKIWHGAVSRRKNSYCFVFISEMKNSKQIFYSISEDGQFFSKPQILIKISKEWKYFYRPFFLEYTAGEYACIYGVVNRDNAWYLSMNLGFQLENMQGISIKESKLMKKLDDRVIATQNISYHIKSFFKYMNSSIRLELYVFIIPLLGFLQVCQNPFKYFIAILFSIFTCSAYLTRFKIYNCKYFFSKVLVGVIESIAIVAIASWIENIICK